MRTTLYAGVRNALICAAGVALPAASIAATAQTYPDRPLRFIVPFVPGGATDIMARTIAAKVNEAWRQPVVVDNRAGGGGAIAAVLAAKSPPDGYTWFIGTISTLATNVAAYRKLPYDPLRDFDPVTVTAITPFFIVVHPSVPAATLAELIAAAKARPGKINYGSSGVGGGAHLTVEYFKMTAGIDLFHIPYKGAAQITTELIGGQIQLAFSQPPSAVPHVRAGKLRALATTASKRVSALPEVPVMAEAGLPGFEANSWQGIVLPKGTPPARTAKILAEVRRILATPEMRERLATEGSEPGGMAPADFRRHMEREIAKWTKVVQATGLTID
ncbi:MAG: tripartite tricarboxylate transporter substrate binding protein [Betaproteobacteria bacterium]|nr:tripartite tricarboxylate transporter substrate binding protein [Betaproteobacteria bacterium]